jgi:hypothetical protein
MVRLPTNQINIAVFVKILNISLEFCAIIACFTTKISIYSTNILREFYLYNL